MSESVARPLWLVDDERSANDALFCLLQRDPEAHECESCGTAVHESLEIILEDGETSILICVPCIPKFGTLHDHRPVGRCFCSFTLSPSTK